MHIINSIVNGLIYPIAIGVTVLLLNSRHVRNWALKNKYLRKNFEEVKAAERFQNNTLKEYDGDQSFELKRNIPYPIIFFAPAFIGAIGIYILHIVLTRGMASFRGGEKSTVDLIAGFVEAGVFLAFATLCLGVILKKIPRSFRVTHEKIFITYLWPPSSDVIHLGDVHKIIIKWAPGLPVYGDKSIFKIDFILSNGKQCSCPMAAFTPTSLEKLFQFLKHSINESRIIETTGGH